jgi:hypothetical protein
MHQTAQAWCLAWGLDMAKHWERCALHFYASVENEVATCGIQHSCIVQCQISVMTVVVLVSRRKREMHATVKPLTSLLKPASTETLRLCKTFHGLFSHVPGTINAFPKTVSFSHLLFVFCDPFTHSGSRFYFTRLSLKLDLLWCEKFMVLSKEGIAM